ncbi:hypothetical protein DYB36_009034 [Aphanomyces astaci]|uniref:PRELI/MSF1 domain-containing protein n=1 Tax=Aphanomyces astaci TaxID=112090 RepID=A0A397BAM5_APHAT|nr:hypothetical protein DYB36_009034 [Aphanomyces astaci]
MGIELVEEVPLPQWQCVYRKRKLQLKNNTPGFIRRFANAEYFDVIEESLWDKANQVLYVVGRNQSFAHLVLIEDFLLFRRHDDHDHCQVTQTGACTVGGSFGFLRGTVEGFVRESYGKSVKKAQEHLVDRLDEECGARTSDRENLEEVMKVYRLVTSEQGCHLGYHPLRLLKHKDVLKN